MAEDAVLVERLPPRRREVGGDVGSLADAAGQLEHPGNVAAERVHRIREGVAQAFHQLEQRQVRVRQRSEEHTSELQSLMRISYAVFCLKKKQDKHKNATTSNKTV